MKRVTLFLGHYGSGKTNVAANYALRQARAGERVTVADLDIVNPYFRTKDWEREFAAEGVELAALPYANTNLDLPAIPSRIYGLVQQRDRKVVFDIGGDDRGAYALGRFTPYILNENDYDMFMVVNFLRPLTLTPEDALISLREIEAAAGIAFTGIINNTNLGAETTADLVAESIAPAKEFSALAGIPVVYTAVSDRIGYKGPIGGELFPITTKAFF